jgi:hypothetical protein
MGGLGRNRVLHPKVGPCSAGLSLGPLVLLLLCLCATGAEEKRAITSWADKWCELNDCLGVQERQKNSAASEWMAKEERKAVRRYVRESLTRAGGVTRRELCLYAAGGMHRCVLHVVFRVRETFIHFHTAPTSSQCVWFANNGSKPPHYSAGTRRRGR